MWMKKNGKGYYATTFDEIMNDWEKGVKFIKCHFDKNRWVELMVYNSDIFTKESPAYEGVVIQDRFQIQYVKHEMESRAFDSVFKSDKLLKKHMNRGKIKIKNWVTYEEASQILNQIKFYVENADHYRTADILCGDYIPRLQVS